MEIGDKILAIAGFNGSDRWMDLNLLDYKKVIFMGSYFDSPKIKTSDQIYNFQAIIDCKEDYPSKFIILLGTSELHYLYGIHETYEHYNSLHAPYIRNTIDRYINKLKLCYIYEDMIFSHAGLSRAWCLSCNILQPNTLLRDKELEYEVNNMLDRDRTRLQLSGNSKALSPVWSYPNTIELDGYGISSMIHITGRMIRNEITFMENIIMVNASGKALEIVQQDKVKMFRQIDI